VATDKMSYLHITGINIPDLYTAQHVSFHPLPAAEVLSSSSLTYGLSSQYSVVP